MKQISRLQILSAIKEATEDSIKELSSSAGSSIKKIKAAQLTELLSQFEQSTKAILSIDPNNQVITVGSIVSMSSHGDVFVYGDYLRQLSFPSLNIMPIHIGYFEQYQCSKIGDEFITEHGREEPYNKVHHKILNIR